MPVSRDRKILKIQIAGFVTEPSEKKEKKYLSSLVFICSLIDDAIYDFFLGWWILFFQSLIKSTLLAGKDLLCLDDKQHNNGRW